VEDRQVKLLHQRKEILIEKRRRRAEREAQFTDAESPPVGEPAGNLAAAG